MKKLVMLVAPLFVSALLFAHPEEPAPSTKADVSWHTVSIIDYKPGTIDTAKELIKKFESASLAAGTPSPVIYWFETGKYDMVLTWELKDGPADLDDSWSPDGVIWKKALVEQEGSEQAARRLQDQYMELIASSVTNVSRKAK